MPQSIKKTEMKKTTNQKVVAKPKTDSATKTAPQKTPKR